MQSLSVIIPTLNEQANIARSVRSAWQAGAMEVIVVDSDSSDRTTQQAEQAGAQVLNSLTGRGTQQNRGAQIARGDWLLFLHADTWLDPACGEQLIVAFSDPTLRAAAFRQHIEAAGWAYRLLERGNAARVRWRGMAYGDQAICLRRELFDRVGGFQDIPLMEDLRLMRAIRPHCKVKLLPGPLHVSARRWRQHGIVRQTLRNWSLVLAERSGASPERLAARYLSRAAQPPADADQLPDPNSSSTASIFK